ncbi:hypothetical protein KL906_003547 [Ogataea polymorpha]|uniref:Major facilitator superfamily (MFS) profile domain-containing protein n=1 Tax=Ogataea polymorpha TaxID=460523 RepID=A0A9P8NTS0_9ASCO|nr:hypothetical protein KL906_003547 [Ogataea polymorpha]KAG7916713.1 hypothetical protein KL927_003352 [Ogataea polymorpha]KAH3659066.1 hypothetical protein OGATHE_006792 [Ogataea polymorpha]
MYYGLRGPRLGHAVAFVAGVGFLLFGYDQGVMGSLLTLPSFIQTFPEMDTVSDWLTDAEKSHNSTIQGVAVSLYEIGCMFGALATIFFGDRLGRIKIVFYGAIIMVIGAIIQAASFGLAQFIVGRIVTGVGNGFITATLPMWLSECAKPEQRGPLLMLEGMEVTGGIALSYWIDFGFYFAKGEVSWRFPIAFQIVFALIPIALILKLPESPRWLIKKNRLDEGKQVLAALFDTTPDDEYVTQLTAEVVVSLEVDNSGHGSFRRLFTNGREKHFHRAMLGYWNQVMGQISGINIITYYAGTIYETSIGLSSLNSRILAAANGTEYFLAAWFAFFTIERVGRRRLMIWGTTGQFLTMGILTGCVWGAEHGNSKAAIAAAVFLFVFNSCFAVGWLSMNWLYPAEITALSTRLPANALSTSANWSFNFMVVMITPIAFNNIKCYTYLIFCAINFLMIFVVYFLYPETKGRSLEEIDLFFEKSNPWKPWDVVRIARETPYTHTGVEDFDALGRLHEKDDISHVEASSAQ